MRSVPTLIHGIFDYLIGVLVIASPWMFHYYQNASETWVPILIVTAMFFYDLLTDYESGILKLISMSTHLWFDVGFGFMLIFSPKIFGFSDLAVYPQMIFGICIILNSILSETLPSYGEKKDGPR